MVFMSTYDCLKLDFRLRKFIVHLASFIVFGAWQERAMFTGTWRKSQKSKWRVEVRATSVESHISSVGRSVVNMADRTARVANG